MDPQALGRPRRSDFFSGRPIEQVFAELRDSNAVIVSEPFTYKHHVRAGDSIALSLGAAQATFRIADVYYDYSSDPGNIVMSRTTILPYLPAPTPSTLPLYFPPPTHLHTSPVKL